MRLTFRQGVVQYQLPDFLFVGSVYVDLIVTNTPTIVTLANGGTDYLIIEQDTVPNAWGPLLGSIDQWLYWDINQLTAQRTFGITTLEPVVSGVAPTSPAVDQHWFDLVTTKMYVWNGTRWVEKLRVFAAMLNNGTVPTSVSINSPNFAGTQIGSIPGDYFSGQILFDTATGLPLRTPTGEFLTTEQQLTTRTVIASQVKFASLLVPGTAQTPLAAYTIVQFNDYGEILYGTESVATDAPYGIIEQDADTGAVVNVVTSGVVSNPSWDFSVAGAGIADYVNFPSALPVNSLLYTTASGQLTAIPTIPAQVAVATVVARSSILLEIPKAAPSSGSATVPVANTLDYGTVRINIPPATPGDPIVVGTNDPRFVYLANVTSDVQAQLDAKLDEFVGTNGNIITVAGSGTAVQDSGTALSTVTGHIATANIHVDHTTVSITGGAGLTGGGTIDANRVISMPNVGTPVAAAFVKPTTDAQGRVSATTPVLAADINTTLGYTAADDSLVVHLAGAENITGLKAFAVGLNLQGNLQTSGLPGSLGEVLTSNGAGFPPSWQPAATGVIEPLNQIVYGTGVGVDSSPNLTWDPTTGQYWLNTTNGSTNSAVGLLAANVVMFAGEATGTSGGFFNIFGGAGSGGGGSVSLTGGNDTGGSSGGNVNLQGGTSTGGGSGGNISIQAGNGTNVGGNVSVVAGTGSTNGIVTLQGGNGDVVQVGSSITLTTALGPRLHLGTFATNFAIFEAGQVQINGPIDVNPFGTSVQITGSQSTTAASAGSVSIAGGQNGSTGNGGTLQLNGGVSNNGVAGNIMLDGGAANGAAGTAGSAYVRGGNQANAVPGGNVYIVSGFGTGTIANSGDVVIARGDPLGFPTFYTEALRVVGATGEWMIGGASGTAGQVIASGGPGLPPTWTSSSVSLDQVQDATASATRNHGDNTLQWNWARTAPGPTFWLNDTGSTGGTALNQPLFLVSTGDGSTATPFAVLVDRFGISEYAMLFQRSSTDDGYSGVFKGSAGRLNDGSGGSLQLAGGDAYGSGNGGGGQVSLFAGDAAGSGTAGDTLIAAGASGIIPAFSLAHFDGVDGATTYIDDANGQTWTPVGGAELDTAQFKFGTAALLMDTSTEHFVVNGTSNFRETGTQDLTLQFWARYNGTTPNSRVNLYSGPSQTGIYVGSIQFTSTTVQAFFRDSSNSIVYNSGAVGITMNANTWYHFAVVYDGTAGTASLFFNGNRVHGPTLLSNNEVMSVICVDADYNTVTGPSVWMDEIRFSPSVDYSTATYTEPASPLSATIFGSALGGGITVSGGNSGNGGGVAITGGDGNTNGDGGALSFVSGDGAGTTGGGGNLTLNAGNASGTGQAGEVDILGGNSVSGVAGAVVILAGSNTSTGSGAAATLAGGDGGTTSGDGGNAQVKGGNTTTGNAGNVAIGRGTTSASRNGDMMYVPTAAGAPTGTPASIAGLVPLLLNTANNSLQTYNSGWQTTGAMYVNAFTKNLADASGSQAVTGVGFKPKAVVGFITPSSGSAQQFSIGFSNQTNNFSTTQDATTAGSFDGEAFWLWAKETNADYQLATIASFDADGFTISWTKTGTPTASVDVVYLAMG